MGARYDQLKPKYKRFVDEFVRTGNKSAAARVAGTTAGNVCQAGKDLLKREDVAAAVAEIVAEMSLAAKVTRETLTQEYDMAYRVAVSSGNPSAMVSAVTGKARLYGLDIQKVEGDVGVAISLDENMDPLLKSITDYANPQAGPK